MNIRICCRIQLGERIFGPFEYSLGDTALDVAKELRVAAQQTHHRPGKEYAEHKPPAEIIPSVVVERAPLLAGFWTQKFPNTVTRMHQRQHPFAEHSEIMFELTDGTNASGD